MSILLLPDILLLALTFAVLGADLFRPGRGAEIAWHLAWSGSLLVFLSLLVMPYDQQYLLFGGYQIDGRGLLFRQLFVLSALFTILLGGAYFRGNFGRRRPFAASAGGQTDTRPGPGFAMHENAANQPGDGGSDLAVSQDPASKQPTPTRPPLAYPGEFCTLVLLATFGMFVVVSATDLLTLLVGLELATIPLYALCGFRKNCLLASEAAIKFVIIGGLSTAVALFGYSFIYGAAGSLHFDVILAAAQADPNSALLLTGTVLVLAGAAFKLTLFPFHLWAPDVYQGAPAPVTAFLSVASKATAVAFLLVLLSGPLAPLHGHLQWAILLLAGATMTVGNLGALRQRNLLRLLAYSSIAQAGYIVLAFVSADTLAGSAIFYYLLVYAAGNFATFFIIAIRGRGQSEEMEILRGLGRHSPALGAVLMLAMFSLAGIPPLAGFTGKFMLFAPAAMEGFHWMVLFAAVNSTVSLYYYLMLIREAYIVAPTTTEPAPAPQAAAATATAPPAAAHPPITIQHCGLIPLTAALLLLGLLPGISTAIHRVFGG